MSVSINIVDDDEEDEARDMARLKVPARETAWLADHTGGGMSGNGYADGGADGQVDVYLTPTGDVDGNGLECGGESSRKRLRREAVRVKREMYVDDDGEDGDGYGYGESSVSEFADAV